MRRSVRQGQEKLVLDQFDRVKRSCSYNDLTIAFGVQRVCFALATGQCYDRLLVHCPRKWLQTALTFDWNHTGQLDCQRRSPCRIGGSGDAPRNARSGEPRSDTILEPRRRREIERSGK